MIVLADGVVLGGGAAVIGLALGVGLASLSAALEAGRLIGGVGPLEIPWVSVAAVALLGAGSGIIAALVPAVQAARQDVASVLGGRRGEVRDRVGRPVLGLILLIAGMAAVVFAVRIDQAWVIAAALLAQLGLVALAPRLVKEAARLAARLPLPFRLAARDASRHRGRTASAVAAVMTAAAAVVAVGIAGNSDFAARRDAFQAAVPAGTTMIKAGGLADDQWAGLRAATERKLRGVPLIEAAEIRNTRGATLQLTPLRTSGSRLRFFGHSGGPRYLPIGDERLLTFVQGRRDPVASAALASGKAVVFDPDLVQDGQLALLASSFSAEEETVKITIPAVVARAADPQYAIAVLPVSVVRGTGLETRPGSLYIDPISYRPTPQQELELVWDLRKVAPGVGIQVEGGFQENIDPQLWLLLGAALVLVLGGTFVATGLAAADMRPDLATMSAVGAPSGTRRLVVAGQACFIAGLGVLIGAVAGSMTGVALLWSTMKDRMLGYETVLTPTSHTESFPELTTVEIPWLFLAAVVIGLPVLAALVAGAFTRTRVELTRRPT
ncbi:FtsX-like permease family protein [Streptosporangium lutulentum]